LIFKEFSFYGKLLLLVLIAYIQTF